RQSNSGETQRALPLASRSPISLPLLAPLSREWRAIRRASETNPCNAARKLRPVACRARRGLVGDRKRLAHPTQPTFRCAGDRVLGTRPHSAHALTTTSFKARGFAQDRRAHLGLSHLLRIRRLGCRHRFFYFGAEVWESHRRKCDPDHSTGHLHARRALSVWRSPDPALL